MNVFLANAKMVIAHHLLAATQKFKWAKTAMTAICSMTVTAARKIAPVMMFVATGLRSRFTRFETMAIPRTVIIVPQIVRQ